MTNTNPITATQYNQQVQAYDADVKKEQEKMKQKQQERANAEAARVLVEGLCGGEIVAYNNGDIKDEYFDALDVEIKARLATEDTSDDLSEEQIKLAKKYIKSKEFKNARQQELDVYYQSQIYAITGNDDLVTGTSAGAVRKDVREELKRQLENGEISEEQYKFLKKKTDRRGFFPRIFGTKKKDSERLFQTEAYRNNRDQVQAGLLSDDTEVQKTAQMKNISPELMAKIEASGYSIQELIDIFNNNGGWADATVNYSYNKDDDGQIGEVKGLRTSLNANPNGFVFSEQDVKDIGKALGYQIEKTIDWGKVVQDGVKGAVVMSPAMVGVKATAVAESALGAAASTATATTVLPIGTGIGLVSGVAHSIDSQRKRVEDKAIPDDVYEGVTTYDDYCKKLKDGTTNDGYRLGAAIAKFFTKPDGTLDIAQMEQHLHKSAGTVSADKTPLNYDEARGLLADLTSGKIKIVFEQEEVINEDEDPVTPQLLVKPDVQQVDVPRAKCNHVVQKGDTWSNVLAAKYGVSGNDLKELIRYYKNDCFNKMSEAEKAKYGSSKANFFYPAGTTWELFETLEIGGKEYAVNCDAEVPNSQRCRVTSGNSGVTQFNSSDIYDKEERTVYDGYDVTDPNKRQQFMFNQPQNKVEQEVNSYSNRTYPEQEVRVTYPNNWNN